MVPGDHCTREKEIDRLINDNAEEKINQATMTAKITMMEGDLKEVKGDVKMLVTAVKELPEKMKEYTDETYVRKETFREFEKHLHTINKTQDAKIKDNDEDIEKIENKIWKITKFILVKVVPWIIAGLAVLEAKFKLISSIMEVMK